MTDLDRRSVVELLERLGANGDETVLEAARVLHRTVSESGLTWDDLLRPEKGPDAPEADSEDQADLEADSEDQADPEADSEDQADLEADSEDRAAPKADSDLSADARMIDRLLARENLSEITRDELAGLKRDIADGSFTDMDSAYILAIAKRLGLRSDK